MMHTTRLPTIHGQGIAGQAMPPEAAEFVRLWLARLGPRAAIMVQDPRHTRAAQQHAAWLPTRTPQQTQQSAHIGQGGSTANERLRAEGVVLPDWYEDIGNNVESWALYPSPQEALDALLASPSHHDHLLGLGWFADQLLYGVGWAEGHYIFMASPVEGA